MKIDYFEDKLALFPENSGPVYVDFTAGKKRHRLQFGGGKSQPLARAVGIQGSVLPSIIDATAGMGGDAFVLASLGCQVHMIERSEPVSRILKDALTRASRADKTDNEPENESNSSEIKPIIERLSLTHADASEYLLSHRPEVDTIYMDPMYPEKKKAASAKKEMKALQSLVGPDLDSENLLDAALKTAKLRVVVKRPAKAPHIVHRIQPSTSIKSPNTRYDIYVIKAINPLQLQ